MESVLDDGDGFTGEYVQFFNLCTLHIPFRSQKTKKSVFLSGQKLGPIYIVFLKGLQNFGPLVFLFHSLIRIIEWTCRASWSCSRIITYPWWGFQWEFYLPSERRTAVQLQTKRQCGEKAVAVKACQSDWAGSGTGSSRTPPGRTETSPAGSRCVQHLTGRKRLMWRALLP